MAELAAKLPASLRGYPAVMIGLCVAIALGVAGIGWYSGIALGAVIVLPVLAIGSISVLGVTGSLLVACTASSFMLMNRIDEGVVIPFGDILALKASYWVVMAAAAGLAGVDIFRAIQGHRNPPDATQFAIVFFSLLACFIAELVAGGVFNHFLDRQIILRDVTGEFLASASIIAPMLFVPLILFAPLPRTKLVLIVQCTIALAGLAGLVMAAFGFLPGRLLNMLGWAAANQGSVGMLRGRLPLGHPNAVAAVMILLLPPSVVLGLIPGGLHWRLFYLLCSVLMFGGILFSLARSALLVTVLVLGLTVAYIYFGRGRKTVTTYLLPVFFSVSLVAVMTYLFLTLDFSRFWKRGGYEDATLDRRNASLVTSAYVFKDYPLFGITPDAMYTRLETRPGWEPPMEDNISPIYYYQEKMSAETPHNMYMTVLAETGVLGACCFFGMIGYVLYTLWRLSKSRHLSDEQRHALMGFFLGLIGFLLMGAFEALLMVGLRPAYLFWMMAGLAIRYAHEVAAPRRALAEG